MSRGCNDNSGVADRAQSWAAFDKTLAEARSVFVDMTPAELQSLINEAVAAARTAPPAQRIDEADIDTQAHP